MALALLAGASALLLTSCVSDAPARGAADLAQAEPEAPAQADAAVAKDALDAPQVRRLSRAGWVEVRAAVLASDDEAPADARGRAIGRARQAAVEHVAGVKVKSSLLSLDQIRDESEGSLLQVLSASRSDALVIDEDLVDAAVTLLSRGGYRVDVTLRAQVLDHGSDRNDEFRAEVSLNRTSFRDGEDVELSVRASHDARLYVVGVSEDGAAMLVPSRHLPERVTPAGTWLRLPGERLAKRGVRLRAALPAGKSHAEEALIVIAVRGGQALSSPVPASGANFATASRGAAGRMLNELLAPLVHLPTRDWTFDQVVYSIHAR